MIKHEYFGNGKIISLAGENEDTMMLTVKFENSGNKRLLLKFAQIGLINNF